MLPTSDTLARIEARRFLEEINHYLLHDTGDIIESPGKISLVWPGPHGDGQHFLAVKPAGDENILINGRRYPATEEGLKQGLLANLTDLQRDGF
jgi:hypothetical protein